MTATEFPAYGALMGLDYGTKRVGIAISTPDQSIASALEILHRTQLAQDSRTLCKICKEYRIKGLVVGLPVHMSGDEGEKAREARKFGQWVAEQAQLPLQFWDERFTSSMADSHLREASLSREKRKKRLDMLAAQLMLQSFLDASDRNQLPSALR